MPSTAPIPEVARLPQDVRTPPAVRSAIIVSSPAQTARPGRRPWAARAAVVVESVLVAGYLGVLFAVLLRLASHKQLWFDELFTLHLARCGSLRELLRHLAAGVDLNPPLVYAATWASITVFGDAAWAVRLPGLVGGVATAGLLYAFVRRRRGPAEATLAMAAVTAGGGVWTLFLDARPYGLTCAFAAAALVCWQRAGEGGRGQTWWRVGMAAAFGLGMASHYYYCVVVMALGAAEAVRWAYARRVSWAAVGCFAVPVLVLAACAPLWSTAPKAYAAGFWSKSSVDVLSVQFAYDMMGDDGLALSIAVALGVTAAAAAVFGRSAHVAELGYRPWEVVAMVALAAVPAVGVVLGAKLAGGFYYRYTVASALGLAGLFALACGRSAGSARWACIPAALGFMAFGAVGQWGDQVRVYDQRAKTLDDVSDTLVAHAAGGTVVIESPHIFTQLWHYAADDQPRVVYVADTDRSLRVSKTDTADRGLIAMKRVADVPVVGWDDLGRDLDRGAAVYYYGRGDGWQWHELRNHGVRFEQVAERPDRKLYRLTKG